MSGQIANNIAHIHREIANCCALFGRDPSRVLLLAVSKTVHVAGVLDAVAAGVRSFGENYVQEGVEKMLTLRELEPGISGSLQWHLIGPLQSNKTRVVAEHFDWVHTIDRVKIAQRLSEQRPVNLHPLQVLLQINVDGSTHKSGIAPGDALDLALAVSALPQLRLRGLMSMPDPQADAKKTQELYSQVRELMGRINQHPHFAREPLDTLSMGMSGDMCEAIAAGATMVRIGRGVFGIRPVQGYAK